MKTTNAKVYRYTGILAILLYLVYSFVSNSSIDSDNDGVYDTIDICDGMDDALIGTSCDDGDDCTINDIWRNSCECVGTFWDSDSDNVCDLNDLCANYDDNLDIDNDGIPFCIDNCVDTDDDDICDNIDNNVEVDELNVYFSFSRGIYDSAFNLSLYTNVPDASVKYTLDSEWPSTDCGNLYTSPIPISGTTVVKAITYTATDTSKIVTHTYIFLEDVLSQPDSLSIYPPDTEMDTAIVNDPQYREDIKDGLKEIITAIITLPEEHFIDPDIGIYANPFDRGRASERLASIEFLFADGSHMQENMGVRVHGGASRIRDKKGFRVHFREDYGETKLDYPLFGNEADKSIDAIVLRCRGGQSWVHSKEDHRNRAQLSRDQIARDLQIEMGHVSSHGIQANLYINGYYWGQYNIIEFMNQSFMQSYFGGKKKAYDIFNHSGLEEGDSTSWVNTHYYADTVAVSAAAYDSLSAIVDLENLADYILLNFYAGNTDWDTNNWYASRENVPGGKWRFFNWDCEQYFKEVDLDVSDENNWLQPTGLFNGLMRFPDFRQLFYDRVHCHMENDGVLTADYLNSMWMAQYNLLGKSIIAESARWGDNKRPGTAYTLNNEFLKEQKRLTEDYFPARSAIVKKQLIAAGHLNVNVSPVVYSSLATVVNEDFQLTLSNPNSGGTIYYTTDGNDPRVPGGGIAHNAQAYNGPIIINDITIVRARVKINSDWSANCPQVYFIDQNYADIVINEVNYNSDNDGFDPGDWVELYNPNTTTVDISGWTFHDNNNEFIIPQGSSIKPNDFLVIVEDKTAFSTSFPHLNNDQYIGDFAFGLSNKGERISLFDANKCLSDYLIYNDKLPWDTIPDGNGPSLSLIKTSLDNTLPQSWEASSNINAAYGTPGYPNTPCPENSVILPSTAPLGLPVNIPIDSLYSKMDLPGILF